MIGISRLYCGTIEQSDSLRYAIPGDRPVKPVVVWNCTRRCNLRCIHCYSSSDNHAAPNELTGDEARKMITDIAAFECPVLLFSGGEPLLRPDILELVRFAKDKGLRAVISTNGTLITEELAATLSTIGLDYAGISLDAAEPEINDKFRGVRGAFDRALDGIRNCLAAGVKVGLRLTITSTTPSRSREFST